MKHQIQGQEPEREPTLTFHARIGDTGRLILDATDERTGTNCLLTINRDGRVEFNRVAFDVLGLTAGISFELTPRGE